MRRMAFGEVQDGKVSLLGLDGKPFEGRPEEIDLLLLSRLDCDVRCLELPPVAEREIPALVRYRLRSVYPGSLEHAVIDHVSQRRRGGLVAVVSIMERETLAKFRVAAPRASLSLLSVALLREPALQTMSCFVCGSSRYTEVLKLENGVLLDSVLVKRAGPCADEQRVQRLLGKSPPAPLLILAPRGELESTVQRLGAGGAPEKCALESLELPRRGAPPLFRPPRPWKAPRPAVVRAALAAAVVLLTVGVVRREVDRRQAELSLLRSAVLGSQTAGQRTADLLAQYSEASARVRELVRARPVDLYQFFCDLHDELGPGVLLQDLVLQGESFQFQALGPSPLALMQRFIADPRFHEVRLLQTTPLVDGSRHQFIVTGRYAE